MSALLDRSGRLPVQPERRAVAAKVRNASDCGEVSFNLYLHRYANRGKAQLPDISTNELYTYSGNFRD